MRPLRTPSGHTERLTWDISPEDCPLTPVPVRWFDRTRSLNSVSALRGSYWLGSLAGSNLFIYVFGQTERLTDRDIPFSSESSQFV